MTKKRKSDRKLLMQASNSAGRLDHVGDEAEADADWAERVEEVEEKDEEEEGVKETFDEVKSLSETEFVLTGAETGAEQESDAAIGALLALLFNSAALSWRGRFRSVDDMVRRVA